MTDGGASFGKSASSRLVIEGTDAMNECIERLFLACRRTLVVRAGRLDFDFYASEAFAECCRSIVARDMRNELLFLVEDQQYVMRANVRLAALARQFSSYVKLRVIPGEYIEHQEMFIVRDGTEYLHQPSVERPRGFMSAADRATARRLSLRFKDLWERSAQPTELFTTGL